MPVCPARLSRTTTLLVVCGVTMVINLAQPARADRGPTPSADQVSAAQSAVTDAQTRAAALDAQLAAARQALADAQSEAADADMAHHGALTLLDRATQDATAAREAATHAREASDQADLTLSLLAAEAFQDSAGLVQLDALLSANGPQDAIDRAAGLEAVTAERLHAAAAAGSARRLATNAETAAAEAEQRRTQAAAAAQQAAAEAQADADHLAAAMQALQAQSATLTAQLATLRQTSTDLERARQEGLAAEEQARRDEAARQAGIRAAADAARQEAARQAQQRADAEAAARAATSARQAAAAAAAQTAAQPKPAPTPAPSPTTTVTPPPTTSKPPLNLAMEDMWDRIAWCESSQRWHLNTGNGYYGGLQFSMQAWTDVAGQDYAPRADLASREEQITVANRLYAIRGLKPWSCRTAA